MENQTLTCISDKTHLIIDDEKAKQLYWQYFEDRNFYYLENAINLHEKVLLKNIVVLFEFRDTVNIPLSFIHYSNTNDKKSIVQQINISNLLKGFIVPQIENCDNCLNNFYVDKLIIEINPNTAIDMTIEVYKKNND